MVYVPSSVWGRGDLSRRKFKQQTLDEHSGEIFLLQVQMSISSNTEFRLIAVSVYFYKRKDCLSRIQEVKIIDHEPILGNINNLYISCQRTQ